jgi:hypothetical protein
MATRSSTLGAVLGTVIALASTPLATAGDWGSKPLLRFEFGEYLPSEPSWEAGGISCRSGERIVWNRGFRLVRPVDCHGKTFSYIGHYRGDTFEVFVNSLSGMIIGVGPA